jgi:oxaloacetate decarboxylase gamma subunit
MSLAASLQVALFQGAGWENVTRADGLALALTGMLVVFTALALVSGFIALLPRALARLEARFPRSLPAEHARVTVAPAGGSLSADEQAALAAALAAIAARHPEAFGGRG